MLLKAAFGLSINLIALAILSGYFLGAVYLGERFGAVIVRHLSARLMALYPACGAIVQSREFLYGAVMFGFALPLSASGIWLAERFSSEPALYPLSRTARR